MPLGVNLFSLTKLYRRFKSFCARTHQIAVAPGYIFPLPFITLTIIGLLNRTSTNLPVILIFGAVGTLSALALMILPMLFAYSRKDYVALKMMEGSLSALERNRPKSSKLNSLNVYNLEVKIAESIKSIFSSRSVIKGSLDSDPFIKEMLQVIAWSEDLAYQLYRTADFIDSNPKQYAKLEVSFKRALEPLKTAALTLETLAEQAASSATLDAQDDPSALFSKPSGLKDASEELVSLQASLEQLDLKTPSSVQLRPASSPEAPLSSPPLSS